MSRILSACRRSSSAIRPAISGSVLASASSGMRVVYDARATVSTRAGEGAADRLQHVGAAEVALLPGVQPAQLVAGEVEGGGADGVEEWAERDPTRALERVMARFRAADAPGLPRFWGGAVGFLAYDAVRAWEPVRGRAVDDLGLDDALFVVTDTVVVFDNLRQTVKVVAAACADRVGADAAFDAACARVEAVVAKLRAPAPPLRPLDPHA